MRRMDELWRELDGPGAPPMADTRAVRRRVNAALDAAPAERKIYPMKRKLTYILTAAALAAALTGGALAVSANLNAISAFFGGDPAPVERYADFTPRSVEDKNYVLTVESSVADEAAAYLVVTVQARNDETREFLFSDAFDDIDTFYVDPAGDGKAARAVTSFGYRTLQTTEDSVTYGINAELSGAPAALQVRLGWMEEGLAIETPLTPAPAVTLELDARGQAVRGSAFGGMDTEQEPGKLTVYEASFTPFTCRLLVSGEFSKGWEPRVLFRMADGSIRTQAQMMAFSSGTATDVIRRNYQLLYQFHDVQDLDGIQSIILFDAEYPLDGSKPTTVEHDPALDPFTVPRMERVEGAGYTIPVRALTEKLGGACDWDPATGAVSCTWRGVTIVLRPGDATALVDGKPVELTQPTTVQNGVLTADHSVFWENWQINGFVLRHIDRDKDSKITWGDWYIIP